MKFEITMKDPDGFYDSVDEAIKEDIAKLNLDEDESEKLTELRTEKVKEILSQWFEYSEYLTVVVDTETETIEVKKAN
jgi:hypothetical protein